MKKIFSGKVFDVLPLSDGIIFSYCKDVIDENTIVSYKMISFETGILPMSRGIYTCLPNSAIIIKPPLCSAAIISPQNQ